MKRTGLSPETRILTLQKRMAKSGIDVAFIQYSRDLLYYVGTTQPSCLVVTPSDCRLFVRGGMDFVLQETWLKEEKISPDRGYPGIEAFLGGLNLTRGVLGLELDVIPAETYRKVSGAFSGFRIVTISSLVLDQRMVKDPGEVENLRKACRILCKGHETLIEGFREGMTELELSTAIESTHRAQGHEGQYFIRQFDFFMGRGPLASGKNLSRITGRVLSISGVGLSPSIPAGASDKPIRKGDLVVVDIPAQCQGYHADQSRTYSVGRPSKGARALHDGLRSISDHLLAAIRPGLRLDELYHMAVKRAEEGNLASWFMRIGRDALQVEFIGHGIGLELNEPPLIGPRSKTPLLEGMVLALEMEMTRSEAEVVKLEDMVLVTSNGAELLTITPRELFVL